MPDAPHHTRPLESKRKNSVTTEFDEVSGNNASARGFFTNTMAGGDMQFGRFNGKTVLKDGAPQTPEGTWTFTGGTGKFKGLEGKGTSKGKGTADGGVTFGIEGEYEPAK